MPRQSRWGSGVFEHPPGSRVFWARWQDHVGRRHKKRVGKRTQAQAYRDKMVGLARERVLFPERFIALEKPASWTLHEAMSYYQEHTNAEGGSKHRDQTHQRLLGALWGPRILQDIDPEDIRNWMATRSRLVSPHTVNREFGYLKRVARRAVACGRCAADPTGGVRKLKCRPRLPRYLKPEEDAALRRTLSGRDWLIVELAYRTGLRAGEQFSLEKTQVHLDERYILLQTTKSGGQEIVRLNTRAVEILRELMDRDVNPTPWVLPNARGTRPIQSAQFARRVFRPALMRAGIQRFRWHDLRHTHASWLAIAGQDLYRIMKLMRHKSLEMTLIYAHLTNDDLAEAVEAVSGPPPQRRVPGRSKRETDRCPFMPP